jgi:hypothetical protein
MTATELREKYLPKWPQMLVTGKSVTQEQAKEIIFRTDSFLTDECEFAGGNNKSFTEWYQDLSLLAKFRESYNKDYRVFYEAVDNLKSALGVIQTDYVSNNWASCAFIFGPHGWCSPYGRISYSDNVGKWPNIEDIENDWKKIAAAFPYLDLVVTLMDGEGCEDDTSPVVNMVVKKGKVKLMPGDESVHNNIDTRDIEKAILDIRNNSREQGLPREWVAEYAIRVKQTIEQLDLIRR